MEHGELGVCKVTVLGVAEPVPDSATDALMTSPWAFRLRGTVDVGLDDLLRRLGDLKVGSTLRLSSNLRRASLRHLMQLFAPLGRLEVSVGFIEFVTVYTMSLLPY